MKHTLLAGVLTLGALTTAPLLQATPAQAFTFAPGKMSVGITAADVGNSFLAEFNGQVDDVGITSTNVDGLKSRATFTVASFTSTSIVLNILLENISTDPITESVVSLLGFRSNPQIASASSTGDFGVTVLNDSISAFGGADVNVCFKEGGNRNNCDGGKGGVDLGQSASFRTTLNFNQDISAGLFLDEFGVRYQGIEGEINGRLVSDFSGTGVGQVPTPALLPGLLGMGLAALRNKKKQEEEAAENATSQETALTNS